MSALDELARVSTLVQLQSQETSLSNAVVRKQLNLALNQDGDLMEMLQDSARLHALSSQVAQQLVAIRLDGDNPPLSTPDAAMPQAHPVTTSTTKRIPRACAMCNFRHRMCSGGVPAGRGEVATTACTRCVTYNVECKFG